MRALHDRGVAVLQAPPGAGKTTRVPLALLRESWLQGQVLMLEPRRIAARAAATYMASLLGEDAGRTIGYRTRLDSRVSRSTRVTVVTEGILTRMLQHDPTLDGVDLVIFDEFHERNLVGDVGLALALRTRDLLRPDLRMLVMSATLDTEAIERVLPNPALVTSEGRAFAVEERYRPVSDPRDLLPHVSRIVRESLAQDEGDILVFLPGEGEIRRVEGMLAGAVDGTVGLHPLYGALPKDAQDAAIRPSQYGRRKVVLATSVAETSLTIDGVRVVIDSGVSRVSRFSPRTGMRRLETVRVSRASAAQRKGRAGRTAPGICYRLWPQEEMIHLLPHRPPEILESDLVPLALDLAASGVSSPGELSWIDPPPPGAFAQAREILVELEAVDDSGTITAHGARMADSGAHPRLAHLMLAGAPSHGRMACDLAALLNERDLIRRSGADQDIDIQTRLDIIARDADTRGLPVDRDLLRRIRQQSEAWSRQFGIERREQHVSAGELLALAYPDRVAMRRPGSAPRYVMRNGVGAVVPEGSHLATSQFLVIADLEDRRPDGRVFLAASLEREALERLFERQIGVRDIVEWNAERGEVGAVRSRTLGAITLDETRITNPDAELVARAIVDAVERIGLDVLSWSDGARRLRERLAFLHHALGAPWPDVSDEALRTSAEAWLAPFLTGVRSRASLERLDLREPLLALLDPADRRRLDDLAPTHVTVPSGSNIPIDYSDAAIPVLAVRLQEVFGLQETPRIAGGRVPVTMHLLSPAHRPVQVTRDLAGFWRSSYFDVRRDMRGRYPKHDWPEDPLSAVPSARRKRS